MCGIVGYTGSRHALPLLIDGLKRLEYRGYDSAGIAVIEDGKILRRRAQGKLARLETLLKKSPISGQTAIGHTRWATHGKPSEENSHPHADCAKSLVVVHNGIIENYLELRRLLTGLGHIFESETDTEVVAHLIEQRLKESGGPRSNGTNPEETLLKAVRQALGELHGSYALAVLWSRAPEAIVAAKTASPLIIGLGRGESFLASDIPAFLSHTREAVFLEDGEMALLKPEGCSYFDLKGKKLKKSPIHISWDQSMAEKGGYPSFMLKEIHEQPTACEDTLRGRIEIFKDSLICHELNLPLSLLKKARSVKLIACGTSYHAALIAQYWIEQLAKMGVTAEIASEFRYRESLLGPQDIVVAISQSGETADTLAAVRLAKSRGAKVLCISNTVGSALARLSDFTLYTRCGPELGVASTKAFTGQLVALALFTLDLAKARGKVSAKELQNLLQQLVELPNHIREALKLDGQVEAIAERFFNKGDFLFVGRHLNFPVALEGALKLKEISYIHAEGYAAGELKHGPIALIDSDMPVLALATASVLFDKVASNIEEMKARGARLIVLQTAGDPELSAECRLKLPRSCELFSPVVNIIPLQLLAYHIALKRGCDIDRPRNLAKSVTVE